MKYREFIGIDVSKSHLDVSLYFKKQHIQVKNDQAGFKKMICWINKHIDVDLNEVLFALEHTGLYSLHLSLFLDEHKYPYSLISGLELKRSRGIVRGKNDKMDARAIAQYAAEKKDKLRLYKMPSETVRKLKRLTSYRERLVRDRTAFKTRLKEYKAVLKHIHNRLLFDSHIKMIKTLTEQINQVEKEILKLIKEDKKIEQQFKLVTSIKGVGPQTALMMIILTNQFTMFDKWRKFASYAGTAPFPNESGMFKGKTKTSHFANKRIKTLLNNCANCAIIHNHEIQIYYQKRLKEGKNEMNTKNVVRNKLLARIFAVVQRGTPYEPVYKQAC